MKELERIVADNEKRMGNKIKIFNSYTNLYG